MFRLDPICLMPIDFIVLFTSSSHVSATWQFPKIFRSSARINPKPCMRDRQEAPDFFAPEPFGTPNPSFSLCPL